MRLSMSDVQRLDGWETALRALQARPWRALTFGWGPETFQPVYRLYRTQAAADLIGYDRVADHAHNLPLELLVTLGAVGTAAFAYFAWRLWKEADAQGRAALLGMGVMSLVEPVFFPPAALLFLLLGSSREIVIARPKPRLAAVVFVLAAAALWWVDGSFRPLMLHPHESEANQIALAGALQAGRLDLAEIYLARIKASDPAHRPMQEQATDFGRALAARRAR